MLSQHIIQLIKVLLLVLGILSVSVREHSKVVLQYFMNKIYLWPKATLEMFIKLAIRILILLSVIVCSLIQST
jgi:hypothetical protein